MGARGVHNHGSRAVWVLVDAQHGVLARRQLIDLGLTPKAIRHRLSTGRLHALHCGVYAVGRPRLTDEGRWMAAVLACGEGAVLSHGSAAALWGIGREAARVEVAVPASRNPRCGHVTVHRVRFMDCAIHRGIPATTPARTLLDLATRLPARRLERAVNEADKLDLIDPEALREWLEDQAGRDGVAALRRLLDSRTFVLTDSDLERRFLPIARRAGLPKPKTGERIRGYRVDFLWPDLRLVVETDGLRYHRTASQQTSDRRRDQALTAAGFTVVRFTHEQVARDPGEVERILRSFAA